MPNGSSPRPSPFALPLEELHQSGRERLVGDDNLLSRLGDVVLTAAAAATHRSHRPDSAGLVPDADLDTQREVVDAFLAASRGGDFEALLEVLDPEVVLRADLGPLPAGGSREVRGAASVAGQSLTYSRLGLHMQPALINGVAGLVSTREGEPFSVGAFTVRGRKIVEIDFLADPERLRRLDLTILAD